MTKSEMLNHIAELSEDNIRLRKWLHRIESLSVEDVYEEDRDYLYVALVAQARGYAYAALQGINEFTNQWACPFWGNPLKNK